MMKRYEKLSSFIVMDIVAQAGKFEDTIHFEVGQPDLPPANGVIQASKRAIERLNFAYTPSKGLTELRQKISTHYQKTYGVDIDIERILITPGTSTAFMMAYLLTLESGESVAMSDPSYPCYKNFAYMADANPVALPCGKENGYLLTADMLEGINCSVLHISSPSNPTGRVYDRQSMESLSRYCKDNGITLISDELYHGLVYDTQECCALEFDNNAIVINGFSKYYCMPGFRIGWIIVPQKLARYAEIIAQNLYISAPTISQYAAIEAFDYDYLSSVRDIFAQRRDYLYGELKDIFQIDAKPEGAFYLWCDISKYSNDSVAFAKEMLEDIHVAVTPGVDFGSYETKQYIRFAYTRDIEHMREGVERIKTWIRDKYTPGR